MRPEPAWHFGQSRRRKAPWESAARVRVVATRRSATRVVGRHGFARQKAISQAPTRWAPGLIVLLIAVFHACGPEPEDLAEDVSALQPERNDKRAAAPASTKSQGELAQADAPSSPGVGPWFALGPDLGFTNLAGPTPTVGKFLLRDTIGQGVAVLDADGDGHLDLYFPQGTDGTAGAGDSADRLFLRRSAPGRPLAYEEAAAAHGLGDRGYGFGALAFDYDSDGDDDLLLTRIGTNVLYRNDGGQFVDVTAQHPGIAGDATHWSTGAAAGDVDGDGDLDLYLCNYCEQDEADLKSRGLGLFMGCKVPRGPHGLPAQPDRFFENTGAPDYTLREAGAAHGFDDVEMAFGFQPTFTDLDDDGDLDLYVTCDSVFNFLFVNDGTGRFTEMALPAGAACGRMGQMEAGMGLAVGHQDGDALPELYVTNFSTQSNSLYRNLSLGPDEPWFDEGAELAGCGRSTWFRLAWGTSFGDFDGDGQLDLFVANGHIYHHVKGCAPEHITYRQPNHLFRGDAGRYVEWADQAGPAFAQPGPHRGSASADLDDDGDLDLVVVRLDEAPLIALNTTPAPGHQVVIDVRHQTTVGGPLLRAIGARVTLTAGDQTVVRDVIAGSSFLSTEDPRVHMGLGGNSAPSSLSVRLVGQPAVTVSSVPAGPQLLAIVRPDGSLAVTTKER